jgi:hypothetical protein
VNAAGSQPGENSEISIPAKLAEPVTAAVDPLGRILMIDGANGAIWVLFPDGSRQPRSFLASAQASPVLENPTRIYAGWGLHYYTLDPLLNQVSVFDLQGRRESYFDLERALLDAGRSLDVEFTDLVVDKSGALAVLDRLEGRIFIFDAQGRLIRVLGEDFTGDERLIGPVDLEIDPAGNLYVADPVSGRIVQIGRQGSLLRVWSLRGERGGPFRPARLAYADGSLWAADAVDPAVYLLRPQERGAAPAEPVDLPFKAAVRGPLEIAGVLDGRLLVLDPGEHRLYRLAEPAPPGER